MRATLSPASIKLRNASGEQLDGPSVQTIFVRQNVKILGGGESGSYLEATRSRPSAFVFLASPAISVSNDFWKLASPSTSNLLVTSSIEIPSCERSAITRSAAGM